MKVKCSDCDIKSKAVETLSEKELDFLNKNCAEVQLNPGEFIIKEGTFSTHIAYIKSGFSKVHKRGPSGKDQIIKITDSGRYIGLQTILTDRINRYSASALTDSVICYIDIHSFRELITRNPKFAYELIIYLCQDEQTYFDRFVNLAQKQINGRLADALIYFSDLFGGAHEYHLPLSRSDLAALIGTTRESVARAIREMINTGVIEVAGKKVTILNHVMLNKISING